MRYLILTVLLSVVQAGSPAPRQASNSCTSARAGDQRQTKKKNEPSNGSPSAINQNQSCGTDSGAKTNGNDNTEHSVAISNLPPVTINGPRRDWADWGTWLFAALLAVTSLLQVWLLRRTLIFARRQTHEIKRQRSYMRLQWKAMRDQIESADKQFLMSHRPWVTVFGKIENQDLVFNEREASIAISLVLKNGGTAPALNTVIVNQGLIFGPMPSTPAETRLAIDCGQRQSLFPINNETGALLLPNDTQPTDTTLRTQTPINDRQPQEVWFSLCIRYTDEKGIAHGTGLLWKFIHVNGSHEIQPYGTVRGRFMQIHVGNEAY
ncbi:MAG TPA: hypothetical protein VKS44_11130 [Candidatus Acidoferrales bacterium]|nr:hypothetical protein [Candidatus Acidoferrales bacterium]